MFFLRGCSAAEVRSRTLRGAAQGVCVASSVRIDRREAQTSKLTARVKEAQAQAHAVLAQAAVVGAIQRDAVVGKRNLPARRAEQACLKGHR